MKKIRHNESIRYNDFSGLPEKLRPKEPKGMRSINLMSMFDVAFMESWGLNSEEYDCFCEHATKEEQEIVFSIDMNSTFTDKRKALEVIHKYKELTYEDK